MNIKDMIILTPKTYREKYNLQIPEEYKIVCFVYTLEIAILSAAIGYILGL